MFISSKKFCVRKLTCIAKKIGSPTLINDIGDKDEKKPHKKILMPSFFILLFSKRLNKK